MKKLNLLLICILLLALSLRFFGIHWDQGYHLHPDERMLIMVTERIQLFSQLNPDFFNYGTLPIYLLNAVARVFSLFGQNLVTYVNLLPIGRALSASADILTVFLVFKILMLLTKNTRASAMGAFMYAITFFPIQNSHFFIVDPFLTLWVTLLSYTALSYGQKQTVLKVVALGIVSAAAITTKFTAILFLPAVPLIIVFAAKTDRWKNLLLYSVSSIVFSFVFMPYGFVDYQRFLNDTFLQSKMSRDPYLFPYTLQYVGTVPYWYSLKNIVLWGLGPFLSFFSVLGITYMLRTLYAQKKHLKKYIFGNTMHLAFFLLVVGYVFYFLVIGQSAVKFMRYFLPLYPIFCIAAAWGFERLFRSHQPWKRFVSVAVLCLAIAWTFCFMYIYTVPNTRITATEWILKNIPRGSTIAVEHWDDRLPVEQSETYSFEELQLYNTPDTKEKWETIQEQLQKSDYIIIASNRLYGPLQRIVDCSIYKICYPNTSKYYQDLFSGALPFQKVAEFYVHPAAGIDDQSADESFTVYDHPKIMIFQHVTQ